MNINVASSETAIAGSRTRPAFVYRHVVSFEETNVVGNVYFTRHISWQGRCREMFLKENAPDILGEINRDLRFVTLRVSCEYFRELNALDEIEVQMTLAHLRQHRIGLEFRLIKLASSGGLLAASGLQEVACMRVNGSGLVAALPPASLVAALKRFAG